MTDARPSAAAALSRADAAHAKIEAHEDLCAERYAVIAEGQKRQAEAIDKVGEKLSKTTDGIYNRLWLFSGAIGAGMFAIIMALLFK